MNVGIMCGSYDSASLESRDNNSKIVRLLTMKDYSFVMGSAETGSMMDAKEIIRENGRFLMSVGNSFELARTEADVKVSVTSTFEKLAEIYKNSDVIIFLDGGMGTLSEFMAFLNNSIETKEEKPLILYNESGMYNYILKDLEFKRKEGLIDSSYKLHFDEAKNIEELAMYLEKAENKVNKDTLERGKVR